jgi:hypothetical protein
VRGHAAVKVFGLLLSAAGALAAQQKQPVAPAAAKQLVPDNYADHPAPVQPLPYSHKTHVTAGIQCQFCHTNPDPGVQMTFPPTASCMACHASVAKSKPAIRKLAGFSKTGKPIPWVRVYGLTPGVVWTHRKHLQAGLQCENCHGAVAQMDALAETTSVTAMGACINCHVQNKASSACRTCHLWP